MKKHFLLREASALAAATFATASIFAVAPFAHAQQPPPPPPPTAAPATPPGDQPDIFDAIKKGADKLQREARKTRDIEPELRQLLERQDDLLHRLGESKKELEARDKDILRQIDENKRELTKQQEILVQLVRAVEKLDVEMKAHHAGPPPPAPMPPVPPRATDTETAQPGAPLPVTEPPAKPVPTPATGTQP